MAHPFSDCNALAYHDGAAAAGDPVAQAGHLGKRKRKNKGLEVIFDPEGHKEFVTGFRKRKLQRKADHRRRVLERERQKKLQDRAERKAALRERLDLARYETDSEAEAEAGAGAGAGAAPAAAQKAVFETPRYRTVVTVGPLHLHSDSSGGEDGPSGSEDEGDAGGAPGSGAEEKEATGKASTEELRGFGMERRPGSRLLGPRAASEGGGRAGAQARRGPSRKAAGTFSRLVRPEEGQMARQQQQEEQGSRDGKRRSKKRTAALRRGPKKAKGPKRTKQGGGKRK